MKIDRLLNILKKEIEKSDICESLILFGSAVYDDNPRDIDLLLYRKDFIRPIEFIKYIDFMDYLDKKYEDIGLAFSSGKPRKEEYKIEVDILPFFLYTKKIEKGFVNDIYKNHKILFGKNSPWQYCFLFLPIVFYLIVRRKPVVSLTQTGIYKIRFGSRFSAYRIRQ